jgi:hypothetical protein
LSDHRKLPYGYVHLIRGIALICGVADESQLQPRHDILENVL